MERRDALLSSGLAASIAETNAPRPAQDCFLKLLPVTGGFQICRYVR